MSVYVFVYLMQFKSRSSPSLFRAYDAGCFLSFCIDLLASCLVVGTVGKPYVCTAPADKDCVQCSEGADCYEVQRHTGHRWSCLPCTSFRCLYRVCVCLFLSLCVCVCGFPWLSLCNVTVDGCDVHSLLWTLHCVCSGCNGNKKATKNGKKKSIRGSCRGASWCTGLLVRRL
jgi:hypothetical protein